VLVDPFHFGVGKDAVDLEVALQAGGLAERPEREIIDSSQGHIAAVISFGNQIGLLHFLETLYDGFFWQVNSLENLAEADAGAAAPLVILIDDEQNGHRQELLQPVGELAVIDEIKQTLAVVEDIGNYRPEQDDEPDDIEPDQEDWNDGKRAVDLAVIYHIAGVKHIDFPGKEKEQAADDTGEDRTSGVDIGVGDKVIGNDENQEIQAEGYPAEDGALTEPGLGGADIEIIFQKGKTQAERQGNDESPQGDEGPEGHEALEEVTVLLNRPDLIEGDLDPGQHEDDDRHQRDKADQAELLDIDIEDKALKIPQKGIAGAGGQIGENQLPDLLHDFINPAEKIKEIHDIEGKDQERHNREQGDINQPHGMDKDIILAGFLINPDKKELPVKADNPLY